MKIAQQLTAAPTERSGSALVAVTVVVTAMAVTSLAVVQVGLSGVEEQANQLHRANAQYTAEAALAASMVDLQGGGNGVVFSDQAPLTLGQASGFVGIADMGDGDFGLTASGSQGVTAFGAEVVTAQTITPFWQFGAFGDEGLTLDSNAMVDSFDSASGSYSATNGTGSNAYHNTLGTIGSNADISADGNVKIWGDAVAGPTGSVTLIPSGNATLSGTASSAPAVKELPPIDVPGGTAVGSLNTNGDVNVDSGDWVYEDLTIGGIYTITGPANVVCDDLKLKSGAQIVVDDSSGPVTFYVENDFVMNSNTLISANSLDPAQVSFKLLSDNIIDPATDIDVTEDLIDFKSNAKFYGTIYAPNANLVIDSNFELFGAVASKVLHIDSNAQIHYDENLVNNDDDVTVTWDVVGWRVTAADL